MGHDLKDDILDAYTQLLSGFETDRKPVDPECEDCQGTGKSYANDGVWMDCLCTQVVRGILEPPFSDIRLIKAATGECFDVEGNYLLTLAPSGIEDIVRLADQVQVLEADGTTREKDRYGSI
jgi:hypothetical protein